MKVEFIINGGVSVVLEPESEMEREILKVLVKQQNNLFEVRGTVNVLSKQIRGSVLICKKESFSEILPEDNKDEIKDQSKK